MTDKNIDLRKVLRSGKVLEKRVCMYEVDAIKAFQKLASKQFSDPLDAIRELIANAIDACGTDKKEAKIDCTVDNDGFSITDYGIGMNDERLQALRTLGSSDKRDQDFIGRFGIGFVSLFHKDLQVRRVIVDTTDKQHKQFVFDIEELGKKVSLEEYFIEDHAEHGTSICVSFDGKKIDLKEKIRSRIVEIAQYLPLQITLNGEALPQLTEYGRNRYEKTVPMDKEGVTGFLALAPRETEPKVTLLSRNLRVTDMKLEEMIRDDGRKFIGSRGVIVGVLNYDKLNLVSSRNEVQKDDAWYHFREIVARSVEQFYADVVREYMQDPSSEKRDKILEMVGSINNYFLNLFCYNPEAFRNNYDENSLQRLLIDCPLFQVWNDQHLYSIADLKKTWEAQGKIFLSATDEADLDFIRDGDYQGKVLKKSHQQAEMERALNSLYWYMFRAISIDGINRNKDLQDNLKKQGIVDSSAYQISSEQVDDAEVDENARNFLHEVKKLLGCESVRELLKKHQLNDDIAVTLARINKPKIIASYAEGTILLNLNSIEMQPYLRGDSKRAAQVFLPILGHEISHDHAHEHGNPFYNLKAS